MTEKEIEDCFSALGKAFAERRDLRPRVNKLKNNLRTIGAAAVYLADNPLHDESLSRLSSASDIREDAAELSLALSRLAELDKLLAD